MRTKRITTLAVTASLLAISAGNARALDIPAEIGPQPGKVVIVDFWASWCVPCRRSFPWLDAMQRKYAADGLVVIGINEDADQEAAAGFLDEFPVDFRIIPDPLGTLASQFDLMAMPASFWVGRDGKLLATHLGFKEAKMGEYESQLRDALGLDDTTGGDWQ